VAQRPGFFRERRVEPVEIELRAFELGPGIVLMVGGIDLAQDVGGQAALFLITRERFKRGRGENAPKIKDHCCDHIGLQLSCVEEADARRMRQAKNMETVMSERAIHLPAESRGEAPGRGRLKGRRILVVGGGQMEIGEPDTPAGNGRAMSVLFAREGAAVAVADRNGASAAATVSLIDKENGQAFAIEADVTKEDDIRRMIDEAVNGLGDLDGVVLNVGIGAGGAWLEGTSLESWNTVVAVNLTSHMLSVKYALPKLTQAASIVFISSIAGLTAGSRLPAYDSSKAGLGGLCRHVAFEGARRCIRANVVAPGLMDTAIGRLASRGRPNRASTPVPLGRQGTGWETAYAALFLLSEESAYVTGQILAVDGGLSGL
jgi:NAD(P)-dependent dehydrogenase (short-subunit alcohol dehydrogenase family)